MKKTNLAEDEVENEISKIQDKLKKTITKCSELDSDNLVHFFNIFREIGLQKGYKQRQIKQSIPDRSNQQIKK